MTEPQIPLLPNIPDKACMVTIMFIPENDQQALEIKGKIDEALNGVEVKRFSFSLEQRTSKK